MPIDLQLKIFDSLVTPILLYGCEVIGFGKNDNLEKIHLQFMKRILNVRISTPNFYIYGELGRYPLDVTIKCRILCFWSRLFTTNKLSSKVYCLMYNLYLNGNTGLKWIENIKNIFDEIGMSFIFSNQIQVNVNWIKTHVKYRLQDQFMQKWRSQIAESSRGAFLHYF